MVISIAEKFLSAAEIAVMKLGLSLRIYSARVEMFSQMAENKDISNLDCHNFIDAGGKFTCSVDEIQELMNQVSIYSKLSVFLFQMRIYKITFINVHFNFPG